MPEPLAINVTPNSVPAPAVYIVPGSVDLEALSIFAHYDGAGASGPWLPALGVYSPGGLRIARVFPDAVMQVGDTADVTFAPSLQSAGAGSGGATPFKLISGASTNSTLVQAGPTSLLSYFISNQDANVRYVKLYDKASAPTVGTDVPKWTLGIPGASSANLELDAPLSFSLGLGIGITQGVADNDSTAVAANEIVVNLGFS